MDLGLWAARYEMATAEINKNVNILAEKLKIAPPELDFENRRLQVTDQNDLRVLQLEFNENLVSFLQRMVESIVLVDEELEAADSENGDGNGEDPPQKSATRRTKRG